MTVLELVNVCLCSRFLNQNFVSNFQSSNSNRSRGSSWDGRAAPRLCAGQVRWKGFERGFRGQKSQNRSSFQCSNVTVDRIRHHHHNMHTTPSRFLLREAIRIFTLPPPRISHACHEARMSERKIMNGKARPCSAESVAFQPSNSWALLASPNERATSPARRGPTLQERKPSTTTRC